MKTGSHTGFFVTFSHEPDFDLNSRLAGKAFVTMFLQTVLSYRLSGLWRTARFC